ncbi:hypothetical protein MKX01_029005 [Papaver californicum]|nr:hypothetical protein MKX01_029005 [Papaver californicum]
MKSGTRLDSLVFQLTPTRTRCELVIIANGKTEKVSSGLLNPFLAHLKTAQDQINKGGYSITLEPNAGSDASWFTKGTVERFIRFVSTPEVLERVNTIESEILQIEKAIVVQTNENMGLITVEEPQRNAEAPQKKVEEHQAKQPLAIEGSRPALDSDAEKAIVLYQPEAQTPLSNGATTHEEHSRIQLLRVLETRRTVLRKKQAMAFARAVVAGFDIDDMPYLISFAECFGALRLMDACLPFIELWKVKHETGQWLEIEASEAMFTRSDFFPMGKSELGIETNGHVNNDARADLSSDNVRDTRASVDAQVPPGQHDYKPGQFQHPMYPQWPIHSPPCAPPGYQPYPMQGITYYNYPGSGPYFHPPYPPMEDPRFHTQQKMGLKGHSMDSKDGSTELDNWNGGGSNKRSQDGSELENECSHRQHSRRKSGRSGNKKSGAVVIRNINYITSKKQETSASESESVSSSETNEEADDFAVKDKNSLRASKSEERGTRSTDAWVSNDNGAAGYGQDTDGGHWLAFQTALLRDDDNESRANDQAMFSLEKEAQVTRRTNATWPDPLVPYGQDMSQGREHRTAEFDAINGKFTRTLKASDDGSMFSQGEFNIESRDAQMSVNYSEIEGGRGSYKRGASDEFEMHRQVHPNYIGSQSDPLNENGFERSANNLDGNSSYNVNDESFIIPLRSSSQDHFGTQGRTTIYMDSELPSGPQNAEDLGNRGRGLPSYEPDGLSMLPERGAERESTGYDPALDYEMQVVEAQSRSKEDFVTVDEDPKHKDKKLKDVQSSLEMRRAEAALRKAKPSKLTPPNDAQARAAKLRAYKADLQKMKKEKDEEDRKRLEALKRERQRRIAARGGSTAAESTLPSQLKPRQLPKLSPISHKGSKFCDSEPSPVSPLQRLPTRTTSVGSSDSLKITKPSKLNNSDRIAGNGLSRSMSSIPELKTINNDLTLEAKLATRPIRRLSEPRMNKSQDDSSAKPQRTNPSSKTRVSNGSESNKITTLMSLDKTKAATLPELKIKTPRVSLNVPQNRAMEKEPMQKTNGSTHAITSGSRKVKGSSGKISHENDVDDNPVIEKVGVMLERDTPPTPVVQEIEERMEIRKGSDEVGDKTEVVLEYAAIHAAASPLTADDTVCDAGDLHVDELPSYHQVHMAPADYGGEVLSKFSTLSVAEKPYQAPYARMSSLEDPCTTNVQYTKAPPRSSEAIADRNETVKAQISDFTAPTSVEQIVESSDNHQGKESSKGFKRFLKLGRKNRSSSSDQRNVESDRLSTDSALVDDCVVSAAELDEAHTLKNLISQSETPTGSTPQKASRHLSLLSPFRSKSSEKKQSRT